MTIESSATALFASGSAEVATGEVHVVDHVTLTNDQVALWLGRFHDRYLPGARRRGMRLERVWRTPVGCDATAVHVLWILPGIAEFDAMRAAAGADPGVAAFWAATDGYARARERHVTRPQGPPLDPSYTDSERAAGHCGDAPGRLGERAPTALTLRQLR